MNRMWDISELPMVIKTSTCWADVCRGLGRPPGGSSQATIIRWTKKLGLDVSHFDSNSKRDAARNRYIKENRIPKNELFCKNSVHPRKMVRTRILSDNIIPYVCSICGNNGIWLNNVIALQLDHKNGINNDHRLKNLRFLCPNCHAATSTYGGKNKTSVIFAP